jgi:hypothetical protein
MNKTKLIFTLIMIGLMWMPVMGFAAHVDLAWQAPTTNEDGSPLSSITAPSREPTVPPLMWAI